MALRLAQLEAVLQDSWLILLIWYQQQGTLVAPAVQILYTACCSEQPLQLVIMHCRQVSMVVLLMQALQPNNKQSHTDPLTGLSVEHVSVCAGLRRLHCVCEA